MKKLIFLLALIVFAIVSCMEKKPASFTRLGYFTPYQAYMEKLNGKVESVTEKGYWAIPEGDTYIKGARITKHELDSINYTYDYKASFDVDGDLVSCTTYDENDNEVNNWSISKVNNMPARAEYRSKDTVRYHRLITCDESGNPVMYEQFNTLADTLVAKTEFKGSDINDTIRIQYYNFKGESRGKDLRVYNELGLLTNSGNFMNDGTPVQTYDLVYNDKGFQEEVTFFDKDKNVTGKTHATYEYDEKGNWTKLICKDDRGFTEICERVYTYFK
jgi:hypothetical protein